MISAIILLASSSRCRRSSSVSAGAERFTLYPRLVVTESLGTGTGKVFKWAMNGSGWKYVTRAAASAPRLPRTAAAIFCNRSSLTQMMATCDLLFDDATEAEHLGCFLDAPLHRLVLFAALAEIGGHTRRFLFQNHRWLWFRHNDW